MRFYIAGRISDETDYWHKFQRAQQRLETDGHTAVNPCTLHDGREGREWADFMIRDIKAMLDCDGIYALRCWRWSKGATIEVQLALRLGKVVVYE